MGLLFMTGAATADASSMTLVEPSYTVDMTAYNAVPEQTSSHPNITASGAFSDPYIVAARSQDLASQLPFGTVIEVDAASSSPTCGYNVVGKQIGLRVVADAMNVKMHNRIDILLPLNEITQNGGTENPAIILGICKRVTIHVVGHVDIATIPKTQAQLVAALQASSDVASAQ